MRYDTDIGKYILNVIQYFFQGGGGYGSPRDVILDTTINVQFIVFRGTVSELVWLYKFSDLVSSFYFFLGGGGKIVGIRKKSCLFSYNIN